MRRCPRPLSGLILATVCLRLFAEAGPPLITDDPGTPERGHWEINTAFLYSETAHSRDVQTPLMDVNYGVLDHLQFKVEIPMETTVSNDAGPKRGGLGDSLLGFKYRFLDEDKDHVSMSFYPQVEFGFHELSWSHERGPNTTTALLPFQIEKKMGPITLGVEIGAAFQNGKKPQDFAGLALGHEFNERFELLAEVREQTDSTIREMNVLMNVGFRLKINKLISLLGSAGTTFIKADKDQPRLISYFAVQFTF